MCFTLSVVLKFPNCLPYFVAILTHTVHFTSKETTSNHEKGLKSHSRISNEYLLCPSIRWVPLVLYDCSCIANFSILSSEFIFCTDENNLLAPSIFWKFSASSQTVAQFGSQRFTCSLDLEQCLRIQKVPHFL